MLINTDQDVMGEDFIELVISLKEHESLLKIDVVKFIPSKVYGVRPLNVSIRVDPNYNEEILDA